MEVILKQDIKELGKKDSLVKVSDGYAKNYLIPRGLAVPATAGNINDMKIKQKAQADKQAREIAAAKETAAKIDGKTFTLKIKCGENGKLFGAVSNKDIADVIKKDLGIVIDKKKFNVDEPMKQLGTYDIKVRVMAGVTAMIKVVVAAL
ncbi:MAG: 50S ribosomal protein L9 [Clostridia bacterium]|nr:50S ribosomal protein L9 [Clostridia bacterium]